MARNPNYKKMKTEIKTALKYLKNALRVEKEDLDFNEVMIDVKEDIIRGEPISKEFEIHYKNEIKTNKKAIKKIEQSISYLKILCKTTI